MCFWCLVFLVFRAMGRESACLYNIYSTISHRPPAILAGIRFCFLFFSADGCFCFIHVLFPISLLCPPRFQESRDQSRRSVSMVISRRVSFVARARFLILMFCFCLNGREGALLWGSYCKQLITNPVASAIGVSHAARKRRTILDFKR